MQGVALEVGSALQRTDSLSAAMAVPCWLQAASPQPAGASCWHAAAPLSTDGLAQRHSTARESPSHATSSSRPHSSAHAAVVPSGRVFSASVGVLSRPGARAAASNAESTSSTAPRSASSMSRRPISGHLCCARLRVFDLHAQLALMHAQAAMVAA